MGLQDQAGCIRPRGEVQEPPSGSRVERRRRGRLPALIAGTKNPGNKRAKHIDIKYHKIKEFVADKTAKLIYVPTNRQIADILTKALPKATFQKMRDCMVTDPFAT